MAGVGPRLGTAVIVAAVLWLGFFWATSSPGGL